MRAEISARRIPVWGDIAMLVPLAVHAPLALLPMMHGVRCALNPETLCYGASEGDQALYLLRGALFWCAAGAGIVGVWMAACCSDRYLQLHRRMSALLMSALLGGLTVAIYLLGNSLHKANTALDYVGTWPWSQVLWVSSFSLLPAIVALRHLPRVARAIAGRGGRGRVSRVQ